MLGRKSSQHSPGSTTLIARGAQVTGDLYFSGSLEIEGRVSGNVIAEEGVEARVRVLQTGLVEGNIDVPVVVINGRARGDIHASRQLHLAPHAVVEGNVRYQLLEIENGAQVVGGFEHISPAEPDNVPADGRRAAIMTDAIAEENLVSC